ncbi:MAG: hypothetical protein GX660_11105 [Clostridiaceae bacterium]|nr:hypothetical protein [Clostridiaceae bacterium]
MMKLKTAKTRLTKMDKLTLLRHINICTDQDGNGCNVSALKRKDKLN